MTSDVDLGETGGLAYRSEDRGELAVIEGAGHDDARSPVSA